jgi:hypothetical protein
MTETGLPTRRQHHLRETAIDELKRFIVIILYLWVVFGLLSIHKTLVLSQNHLDYQEHAFAIINALIFGKVLLIGEDFNLGTLFKDRPLVYPVLHKCFIFTVLLICSYIAESVLVGVWHGSTIAQSFPPIVGASVRGVVSVGVMCFVVLLPFFGSREIARVVGRKELWALMFSPRRNNPTLT